MHVLNVFFIMTELVLNKMSFCWSHAVFPVIYATIYGFAQWVQYPSLLLR